MKCDISELKGKTIANVKGLSVESDVVTLTCTDGTAYQMYHDRDCCENVSVEDVCGDVDDLLSTVVSARCETSGDSNYERWTFYIIQTLKGAVTIRWYGESNGYYSVAVDVQQIA